MGFMKLFEAAVKTVVVLPVAVVKDIATMGGAVTDEPSSIAETIKDIKEDIDEIGD